MNSTLRTRLLLAISITIVVVLCLAQSAQYALMRRQLYSEFDQLLGAKVRTLAVMMQQDRETIDIPFQQHPMQEFARAVRPEYYQVWHQNGDVLVRSRRLNQGDLLRLDGDMVVPMVRDIVLPDGRRGRAAGIRFRPPPKGLSLQTDTTAREISATEDDDDDLEDRDDFDFSRYAHVTLVVARDTQDVEASLSHLMWLLTATGVIATGSILGILALLVTRNLNPLRSLARQISQLNEQHLHQQIRLPDAPGELQPVVERLNALMIRLEAAFQREKTFTADVAHELRTPLAGIRSTLEVGLSRHRTADSYRASMQKCLRISQETEAIIATLLSLSRIEAGQSAPDDDIVDLSSLLRHAWLPFAERADIRQLQTKWYLQNGLFPRTDQARLQVAISNLLDNATSYVDDGGRIEIRTCLSEDGTQISVANTGCFLNEEQLNRVFDRFWRGNAARSETGAHCGLGLALTRRIVEFLDGSIRVSSVRGWFTAVISLPAPEPGLVRETRQGLTGPDQEPMPVGAPAPLMETARRRDS
ncbi:MAG: ATP-binding protein [Fuerstiella sp.]